MSELKIKSLPSHALSCLHKLFSMISVLFLCGAGLGSAYAAENVRFYGTLVADPCQLELESEHILVDMGHIDDRFLFDHHRALNTPFYLKVTACDLSVAQTLYITFQGPASAELKDLLAVNIGGRKSGIAIGLQNAKNEEIPLDKKTKISTLISGYNEILLGAYIQAEPSAIANRKVEYGYYQVTSTFLLDYQ